MYDQYDEDIAAWKIALALLFLAFVFGFMIWAGGY